MQIKKQFSLTKFKFHELKQKSLGYINVI